MKNDPEYQRSLKKLKFLEQKKKIESELPHLYGFPLYQWGVDFMKSTSRMKVLCAANQISKSSTLVRHAIDLATDKSKWPKHFPKREPMTFWYVYPDENKVEEEFTGKWVTEFLPRGDMKDDPVYGWKEIRTKQKISVQFNSGVLLVFKTWRADLQSSTLDAVFIDEEPPWQIFPELSLRVARYSGMLCMAFTATENQDYFYRMIELRGKPGETFPEAFKMQVSMEHDCRHYADGTPSPWTAEAVDLIKRSCGSQTEIDRRVHGRFVTEIGVKYVSFSREKNFKPPASIPPDWHYYSGVDIGSGGKNHPAAIAIVAVKPDYTYGRVVRFWKGNNTEETTNDDILKKYTELTKGIKVFFGEYYDSRARDFYLLSERHGFAFQKANKDRGEDMLNVLFKNEMLDIEEGPHTDELAIEFMTLRIDAPKTSAKDDGIDACRYAISNIEWNLKGIETKALSDIRKANSQEIENQKPNLTRRRQSNVEPESESYDYEQDIDDWNDISGGF